MRHVGLISLILVVLVMGCAYKAAGPSATAVKVRSSYAEKIKGSCIARQSRLNCCDNQD